jgi:hypothetical protein
MLRGFFLIRRHGTLEFLTPKEFAQKEETMLLENSNVQWHYNRGGVAYLQ